MTPEQTYQELDKVRSTLGTMRRRDDISGDVSSELWNALSIIDYLKVDIVRASMAFQCECGNYVGTITAGVVCEYCADMVAWRIPAWCDDPAILELVAEADEMTAARSRILTEEEAEKLSAVG